MWPSIYSSFWILSKEPSSFKILWCRLDIFPIWGEKKMKLKKKKKDHEARTPRIRGSRKPTGSGTTSGTDSSWHILAFHGWSRAELGSGDSRLNKTRLLLSRDETQQRLNAQDCERGTFPRTNLFSFQNYRAECQLWLCSAPVGELTSLCLVFPSTKWE